VKTIIVTDWKGLLICRDCVSDEEYVRRQLREEEVSGDSMKSLRWDGATLRKARNATLTDCQAVVVVIIIIITFL